MSLLDLLISPAAAQTVAAPAGGGFGPLIMIAVMFVVMWFLMIRPQMKKQKEHRTMIDALAKGDEIATVGGLLGKVNKLTDSTITLEIANGVEVQLQRHAVVQVLPKGSIK